MIVGGENRAYNPQLPAFYNEGTNREKICLSYFITILYDSDTLDTLIMSIVCMPNGKLEPIYKTDVLSAGKNPDKTRFRFTNTPKFRLLSENDYRIKVVVFKKDMDIRYLKKVKFFEEVYSKQSINEK